MSHYPVIRLHAGREQPILRRHQWIFSNAIRTKDQGLEDGQLVYVADSRGQIIATGHYQSSSLCVRILAFSEVLVDHAFWVDKLHQALESRAALGFGKDAATTTFRLVHGEGDELPGLIIDRYGPILALQAHSAGMFHARYEIAEACMALDMQGVTGVYDKRLPAFSMKAPATPWLAGQGEDAVVVRENGIPFTVDIAGGQKTGFFIDQRNNRQMIGTYAHGKQVLNLFCYTGGFTSYALHGGATHVTSIDSSASAINLVERNLTLIEYEGTHESLCTDVLKHLTRTNTQYDLIICDPPAFAKSIHKRHNAVQAYKRLNILAMNHLRPGGLLFTFSCSQVVDRQLFHDTLVAAAIEHGKPAKVLFEMTQGPDHPVSLFHPEGKYLKGLALQIG